MFKWKLRDSGMGCLGQSQLYEMKEALSRKTGHGVKKQKQTHYDSEVSRKRNFMELRRLR